MQLVIGYGNPIRADDGFGPAVIEALEDGQLAGVELLAVHQLTPELAPDIAQASRVIFVDATAQIPAGELRLQPLGPQAAPRSLSHNVPPEQLLELTAQLYGNCPPAHLLTVGVVSLDYADELTPLIAGKVGEAAKQVIALLQAVDGKL